MSATFVRERRYIVVKISDAEKYLSLANRSLLVALEQVCGAARIAAGKPALECVVIESDWPEYEPTWKEIEARMTEQPGQLELAKAAVAHVLNAIADDSRKYWLLGNGTESYAKLTAAAAALFGEPIEKIRADFRPDPADYEAYRQKRNEEERLAQRVECLERIVRDMLSCFDRDRASISSERVEAWRAEWKGGES